MRMIMDHQGEGTFVGITTVSDPAFCWVCFFQTVGDYHSMIRSDVDDLTRWHTVQC
jgi:hypothetical protein